MCDFFISLLHTDFSVLVHNVELHIMLQDVSTLKSPNIIVFLKLNDLFVKNNNVVINKRLQSS
jgi:hypothetical protein